MVPVGEGRHYPRWTANLPTLGSIVQEPFKECEGIHTWNEELLSVAPQRIQ